MSVTDLTDGVFGAGGDEPYAAALRSDGDMRLADPDHPEHTVRLDVGRWSAPADVVDRSLLDGVDGPVIDIGCGPGRMLVAAAAMGLPALGLDVSRAAVRIAKRSGARAVRGSVFDRVPDEGRWDTALVIDGNIGIGGDPTALLARCAAIVRSGGTVLVEAQPDPTVDHLYTATVTDDSGRTSASFPWAEVGRDALVRYAGRADLVLHRTWTTGDRTFCAFTA